MTSRSWSSKRLVAVTIAGAAVLGGATTAVALGVRHARAKRRALSAPVPWDVRLGKDCMRYIIKFLNGQDLLRTERVSKRWYALSVHALYWSLELQNKQGRWYSILPDDLLSAGRLPHSPKHLLVFLRTKEAENIRKYRVERARAIAAGAGLQPRRVAAAAPAGGAAAGEAKVGDRDGDDGKDAADRAVDDLHRMLGSQPPALAAPQQPGVATGGVGAVRPAVHSDLAELERRLGKPDPTLVPIFRTRTRTRAGTTPVQRRQRAGAAAAAAATDDGSDVYWVTSRHLVGFLSYGVGGVLALHSLRAGLLGCAAAAALRVWTYEAFDDEFRRFRHSRTRAARAGLLAAGVGLLCALVVRLLPYSSDESSVLKHLTSWRSPGLIEEIEQIYDDVARLRAGAGVRSRSAGRPTR